MSTDECVPLEDFGIYLTPDQARAMLGATAQPLDDDEQPSWANPFAFRFPEDGTIHDVHRLVHSSFNTDVSATGAELVYGCAEANCVNPRHAEPSALEDALDWRAAVVERVTVQDQQLELVVSDRLDGQRTLLVDNDLLTRFGLGDASSLLERVVFVAAVGTDGAVQLVPAARRLDLSGRSVVAARATPAAPDPEDPRARPAD